MNQDRFNTIDSLLEDVIDLPTLEREKILNDRCRDDLSLKSEVLEMLDSLENEDDFIERSSLKNVNEFFNDQKPNDFIGKKIGVYRVKELIGRGGMSVVYLASRIDDFEKEVAVKIIPPFDNRERLAENFRRERQILANLSHPYIAQILDGGTTEDGKPYLVMEYVDGIPLDEFCETNELDETEILELFQKVSQAVTFAHNNFIVHRDLKPPNILIKKNGTPKLLDFGIAKLLDDENSLFRDNKTFDGNALTLEYASPEQITGGNITAASDVYSLGVILYKLLTGRKPHDLEDKSLADIVKNVTTAEPIAPSQINADKQTSTKSELDYITLKSLANSPKERYRSVEEFEHDIENYLNNLPVLARPATSFYRFKKFVRRQKIQLAVASLLVLTLFGWLATSVFQVQTSRELAAKNRQAAYSAEMILAAKEYENGNLKRIDQLVQKYIPQNGEEDIRSFEWYFLNNLANPAGIVKTLSHSDEIWGVAFSPDSKFLATTSNDNSVRIWDVETGKVITEVKQKGAWKVAFLPDGERFAVASSSKANPVVKVYETLSGDEVYTLRGHEKRVRALAISPDGKWIVSGGYDGRVIFWNSSDGSEYKRFFLQNPNYAPLIKDVAFSPDGSRLVVAGLGILSIIDAENWQITQNLEDKISFSRSDNDRWKVAFSPTENVIGFSTYSGKLFLLDAENFKILKQLSLHALNIKSFDFSPDGNTLITASWDRNIKFIDVASGEVIKNLLGHTAGVHDILFSPNGKTFATASGDFKVNIWDTKQILQNKALLDFSTATAFDESNNDLYVSFQDTIRKQNLDSGKVIWEKKVQFYESSIDYLPKTNKVALAGIDGILFVFDAADGNVLHDRKLFNAAINALKFSPDGKTIYAGYSDGFLRAYDTETFAELFKTKVHTETFRALDVSPDGRFLATGGEDRMAKIVNATNGKIIHEFKGNTKQIYKTVFSPDSTKLVITGANEIGKIRRVSDGKLLHEIMVINGYSIAFTPDGKRIATGSATGVIRLWDTETGQEVLAFSTKQKLITQLFFTANSKKLLSIDGKVNIWFGG